MAHDPTSQRLCEADHFAEAVRFLLRAAAAKGQSWGVTPDGDGVKLFVTGLSGEQLFEALTTLLQERPR